jgi:TonB family protein
MFASRQVTDRRYGMVASFLLHFAAVAILVHQPKPVFVTVQSVKLGNGSKSYHVVYVPPDADFSGKMEPAERDKLAMASMPPKRRPQPSSVRRQQRPDRNPEGGVAERNAHAGTIYGSLWALMEQGHDVRPAYPVVYPSPDFSRVDFPPGYQGDVVVEVSIDRDGFVFETKVIQSVGPAVDAKALAAVQQWRFHPAMIDGRPIASKHDVHFHLPS